MTNKHDIPTPKYITAEVMTSTIAICALLKASDGFFDFLITLAVIFFLIVLYGVYVAIWRFFVPRKKGCGAELEVGSQWTLHCGQTPDWNRNPVLCKHCDTRTGTPRKEKQ